ncbi:MAG: MliC family protein [Comamonadaceae bacterium]|nr:MliC family protein [Comamonadaceae bacterium]
MKVSASALFAAALLCACSATPPAPADLDVAFTCPHGESVSVRFSPASSTAVLTRHGERMELRQQPSGSGFIYSNGPNTIRGKGDDLTLEIGRMAPIECKAR